MWNSTYIVAESAATVAPNVNVDTCVNRTTLARWARFAYPANTPTFSLDSINKTPMTKL